MTDEKGAVKDETAELKALDVETVKDPAVAETTDVKTEIKTEELKDANEIKKATEADDLTTMQNNVFAKAGEMITYMLTMINTLITMLTNLMESLKGMNPKTDFISVVLPAPFSPNRPIISPCGIVSVTSSSAFLPE